MMRTGAIQAPVLEILVADDVFDVREVISETLASEGHVVTAVADGEAALKQLRNRDFDILFTDLNMPPGISGFALIDAMKQARSDVPIVVISGTFVDRVNNEIARRGDVMGTLRKPFQLVDLLEFVDKIVRMKLGA